MNTDSAPAAPAAAAPRTTATPLRRISRGSLGALSASRSRPEGSSYDGFSALSHLVPVFAELSEGIEDLAVNLAALDEINNDLDAFNEGFAGLLYGLRMNAYTCAFPGVRADRLRYTDNSLC